MKTPNVLSSQGSGWGAPCVLLGRLTMDCEGLVVLCNFSCPYRTEGINYVHSLTSCQWKRFPKLTSLGLEQGWVSPSMAEVGDDSTQGSAATGPGFNLPSHSRAG